MTGRNDRRPFRRPSEPAAKKELGQHFLIDENLLGVIGRLAELDPDDVVLEVGPGLGVLTGYLADRTRHLHAVELDRSLEPHLREVLAGRENVELHFGDALQLDLAALEPKPTKLVSNLPYNIATPLVVESLDGLPSLTHWTVMVQREVADRFFAQPVDEGLRRGVGARPARSGAHGVSPGLAHGLPAATECRLRARRVPPPGSRRLLGSYPRVKEVVGAAFAHRRKRLPNSLELAGAATREQAAAALESIGRDPGVRAEELAPPEFVALAEALDR